MIFEMEGQKNAAYKLYKQLIPHINTLKSEITIKVYIRLMKLLLEQYTDPNDDIDLWEEIATSKKYLDDLIQSVKNHNMWLIADKLLYLYGRVEIMQMNFESAKIHLKEGLTLAKQP